MLRFCLFLILFFAVILPALALDLHHSLITFQIHNSLCFFDAYAVFIFYVCLTFRTYVPVSFTFTCHASLHLLCLVCVSFDTVQVNTLAV